MSLLKLVLSASSSQSLEEERDFKEHGARLIDLNNFSLTLARPHVCEEREIRNLIICHIAVHVLFGYVYSTFGCFIYSFTVYFYTVHGL